MSTRNGKIARLPQFIREQLNRRLQDGEPGGPLLEWLNGLPAVVEVMEEQFDGVPINKQSLSQWRLGGFEEWVRHEEAREDIRQLAEHTRNCQEETGEQRMSEMLADFLSMELARTTKTLLAEATDAKERWRVLKDALEQLAPLRRQGHQAARVQLEQERWQVECERREKEEGERDMEKVRQRLAAPIWGRLKRDQLAKLFGGGKAGEKVAEALVAIENLHPPDPTGLFPDAYGQGGSDRGGRKHRTSNAERRTSNLATEGQGGSDSVRVGKGEGKSGRRKSGSAVAKAMADKKRKAETLNIESAAAQKLWRDKRPTPNIESGADGQSGPDRRKTPNTNNQASTVVPQGGTMADRPGKGQTSKTE